MLFQECPYKFPKDYCIENVTKQNNQKKWKTSKMNHTIRRGDSRALQEQSEIGVAGLNSALTLPIELEKLRWLLCIDCLISEEKGKNSKLTSIKALLSVFENKSLIFIFNFQGYLLYYFWPKCEVSYFESFRLWWYIKIPTQTLNISGMKLGSWSLIANCNSSTSPRPTALPQGWFYLFVMKY